MKILTVEKYKGSTYCLELDEHPNVYIGADTVEKYSLRQGLDLPEAALDEIIAYDLERKARQRAMYLLTVRDYCFVELYHKLEKNYPHEISLSVCKRMTELGFVNDSAYAEKLARELFEVKKLGMFRAKQEMKRRGLTENIIEDAVEPYINSDTAFERLEELVEKKYERYLTDEKGVKKVKSALARAGYSYDEINRVFDLYDLDFDE